MSNYFPVIGLEVHIELSTASKMFCRCPADHFAKSPNSQVCPTCLGLPGAMPYPNIEAVKRTVKLGLALGSTINEHFKFDRKHYFYPDLPKGYQISQYDFPICTKGEWQNQGGQTFHLRRIHLEEDTAKLMHEDEVSLLDYNRSGVPLVELVTEPDFENVADVVEFLKELQEIIRTLGISCADMEKGSLRLEANLSLKTKPDDPLPNYKVELKNINSFRFLATAMEYEIERQSKALEAGVKLTPETRGYDQVKKVTFSQRVKESENDYRYFPEPDLPVFLLPKTLVAEIQKTLPPLPGVVRSQLTALGLREDVAKTLSSDQLMRIFFFEAIKLDREQKIGPQTWANLIVNKKIDTTKISPAKALKELLVAQNRNYASGEETETVCLKVISANPKALVDYQNGKVQILGYLIALVQKELKGTGRIDLVSETLTKLLQNHG